MKTILQIFITDVKRISRNVVAVVVIMGLTILPSLYAWFNIFSNWDPYGPDSTSNLNVAIFSEDEGVTVAGVSVNIGESVVDALRSNDTIGWVFTETVDEAVDGVYDGSYYAALVIPENFTEEMISFLGGELENPTIGGTDSWRFSVTGDYGVNLMEYRRPLDAEGEYENEVTEPQAGDEVRFDIVLGGEATSAVLYTDGNSVSFDSTLIKSSGEVVGKVNSANPYWGIVFLNAQGEAIMEMEL